MRQAALQKKAEERGRFAAETPGSSFSLAGAQRRRTKMIRLTGAGRWRLQCGAAVDGARLSVAKLCTGHKAVEYRKDCERKMCDSLRSVAEHPEQSGGQGHDYNAYSIKVYCSDGPGLAHSLLNRT